MFSKYKLLPIFLLLFSCSKINNNAIERVSVDDSNFDLVNGILKHNNSPFSGFVFDTYSNGKLKSEKQFLEGRKNGYEKYWFSNDSLSILRHFKNGVKIGTHQSWWNNRQLKFMYHFNDKGMYDGSIKEWYPNGQLAKDFNFIEGVEDGPQKLFKLNGAIKANYIVVNEERYGLIGLKKCYSVTSDKNEIQ